MSAISAAAHAARPSLARATLFVRLVAEQCRRDAVPLTSSALAFITIFAMVPMLAAFSFVGAGFFDDHRAQVLELLGGLLPYTEEALLAQLDRWLSQAEAIRQYGALLFMVTGMAAFFTVEETINRIWGVSEGRTLRAKLVSFTLVLFWGPLVVGLGYSALVRLAGRGRLAPLLARPTAAHLLPTALTLLGLTMLYWQVPATRVRFRAALAGGATATLILELLRQFLAHFSRLYGRVNHLIYGGFALALLFMMSIALAWTTVLLGAEIAYVGQNLDVLGARRRLETRHLGPWIALAALALLARRVADGQPVAEADALAGDLGISPDATRKALAPLLRAGLLTEVTVSEGAGYVLARDPHQLPLREVLPVYEGPLEEVLATLPGGVGQRLRRLRSAFSDAREQAFGGWTVADLACAAPGAVAEIEGVTAS